MFKKSIIALVTLATLSGAVMPAFADTGAFGQGNSERREFAADSILTRLQQQGVKATSVEEWGGLIRAYVSTDGGHQAMQFFDADTLAPVAL